MSYWVYENWVAESKAVVHDGACRFCNEGQGTGRNLRGDRNGRWHGAYGSVAEASTAASATGRPVRLCRCAGVAPRIPIPSAPAEVSTLKALGEVRANGASALLTALGFVRAGSWHPDPAAKGGARVRLDALQRDRVIYGFVVDDAVSYIGICDSSETTLSDRMSRYQNLVGAGTNERIVGLIRTELAQGRRVEVWALKPPEGPNHLGLPVDYVKGLEFPLIERLNPTWNRRR